MAPEWAEEMSRRGRVLTFGSPLIFRSRHAHHLHAAIPGSGSSQDRYDRSYLLLAPDHGGRLVRWVHHGQDILFWPDDADWSRVAKIRGGNPLLFPFIGRHFVDGEAGKWRDPDGTVHSLPQRFRPRSAVHVTAHSDSSISLTLTSSDATRAGYPYDFAFAVTYRLTTNGLEVTLTTRNLGSRPALLRGPPLLLRPAARAARGKPPVDATVRTCSPEGRWKPHGTENLAIAPTPSPIRGCRIPFTSSRQRGALVSRCHPARLISNCSRKESSTPWYAVTAWTEKIRPTSIAWSRGSACRTQSPGQGLRWLDANTEAHATCRLDVKPEPIASEEWHLDAH
jgi:aldose 1-epimerase